MTPPGHGRRAKSSGLSHAPGPERTAERYSAVGRSTIHLGPECCFGYWCRRTLAARFPFASFAWRCDSVVVASAGFASAAVFVAGSAATAAVKEFAVAGHRLGAIRSCLAGPCPPSSYWALTCFAVASCVAGSRPNLACRRCC